MSKEVIKIANCSGYYGDKLSAAKELVDGGPIDVLTGDYLAELTMAILYGQKIQRGEDKGYVGTFLKQIKDVAASCKEKNIKIVSNAGGLNPSSMAHEIEQILNDLRFFADLSIEAVKDSVVDPGNSKKDGWLDQRHITDNLIYICNQTCGITLSLIHI